MSEKSYNGWPASRDPKAIGIVGLKVAGRVFPNGIKGGAVKRLFQYYLAQYHLRVESLAYGSQDDEWGYYFRLNRNANNITCHGSGTAVDANAMRHPNGKRHTLSPYRVAQLRKIQAEVDHLIKWGGDFSGTPDEMHHELAGGLYTTAGLAKIRETVRRLENPKWFTRDLYLTGSDKRKWLRGEDVEHLQRRLGIDDDGVFGPDTRDAVKRMQRSLHFRQTGKVVKAFAFYIG